MYICLTRKVPLISFKVFCRLDLKILVFLISALLYAGCAKAQYNQRLFTDRQKMFLEAESHFLFGEYMEALQLYLRLLEHQSNNAFLQYRTGKCFLALPGRTDQAIRHLEEAVENIDNRHRRRPTYRNDKAPPDAFFHLGRAYHTAYRFEESLEMYSRFRARMDPSVYNIEIVDEYSQASLNAIESIEKPVFLMAENIGDSINSGYSETNPAISGDEKVLVFTRSLPGYDGIFFSTRTEQGGWSSPVEIGRQLGCKGDCYPASLSWDGSELYIYKSDNYIGNIYVSSFEEDQWTPVRKLNDNINTRYWESHASTSRNGDTLYFSSNRPGGYGGLDIYYSVKDKKGEWGPAVNIGSRINTGYNEDTPFITEGGRKLFFSSHGHYNIGGYDIFFSEMDNDGEWSYPVNAGYGINTPCDNLFFNPLKEGNLAYYSRISSRGNNQTDIYRYEIFSEEYPRKFLLKGRIIRLDGQPVTRNAGISIVDPENGNYIDAANPDTLTGDYQLMVPQGHWKVKFTETEHEDFTWNISLPMERSDPELILNAYLGREFPEFPDDLAYIPDPEFIRKSPVFMILPEDTAVKPVPEDQARIQDPERDTIDPEPEHFDLPVPDDEKKPAEPGRTFRAWWILGAILFIFLIFFYRKRRKKRK